jgi:hypothetical protein
MGLLDDLINNCYLNGNGNDEQSGNSFNLTGAVYSTTAKLGSHSVFFDGVNDIAAQQAVTNLDRSQPFALVCWFKAVAQPKNFANIMGIRRNAAGSQGDGWMTIRFNNTASSLILSVSNTDSIFKSLTSGTGYEDDNWHLLIVGRNSANRLRMNIDNGTEDLTGPVLAGNWWEATDIFRIGASITTSENYKGNVDNTLTYQKWPTTAEIAELWNGGVGVEIGVGGVGALVNGGLINTGLTRGRLLN